MAVTFSSEHVMRRCTIGYLTVPIAFGSFEPVVETPYCMGVIPASLVMPNYAEKIQIPARVEVVQMISESRVKPTNPKLPTACVSACSSLAPTLNRWVAKERTKPTDGSVASKSKRLATRASDCLSLAPTLNREGTKASFHASASDCLSLAPTLDQEVTKASFHACASDCSSLAPTLDRCVTTATLHPSRCDRLSLAPTHDCRVVKKSPNEDSTPKGCRNAAKNQLTAETFKSSANLSGTRNEKPQTRRRTSSIVQRARQISAQSEVSGGARHQSDRSAVQAADCRSKIRADRREGDDSLHRDRNLFPSNFRVDPSKPQDSVKISEFSDTSSHVRSTPDRSARPVADYSPKIRAGQCKGDNFLAGERNSVPSNFRVDLSKTRTAIKISEFSDTSRHDRSIHKGSAVPVTGCSPKIRAGRRKGHNSSHGDQNLIPSKFRVAAPKSRPSVQNSEFSDTYSRARSIANRPAVLKADCSAEIRVGRRGDHNFLPRDRNSLPFDGRVTSISHEITVKISNQSEKSRDVGDPTKHSAVTMADYSAKVQANACVTCGHLPQDRDSSHPEHDDARSKGRTVERMTSPLTPSSKLKGKKGAHVPDKSKVEHRLPMSEASHNSNHDGGRAFAPPKASEIPPEVLKKLQEMAKAGGRNNAPNVFQPYSFVAETLPFSLRTPQSDFEEEEDLEFWSPGSTISEHHSSYHISMGEATLSARRSRAKKKESPILRVFPEEVSARDLSRKSLAGAKARLSRSKKSVLIGSIRIPLELNSGKQAWISREKFIPQIPTDNSFQLLEGFKEDETVKFDMKKSITAASRKRSIWDRLSPTVKKKGSLSENRDENNMPRKRLHLAGGRIIRSNPEKIHQRRPIHERISLPQVDPEPQKAGVLSRLTFKPKRRISSSPGSKKFTIHTTYAAGESPHLQNDPDEDERNRRLGYSQSPDDEETLRNFARRVTIPT